jgi:hypothetical protein
MAVDIPRKSLLFGMLLLSDVLRFGLAMWRPSFWSQDCDLDKAGEKTRGFYDEPEVFHIYEENPRFLSAPEEFCRFGCLRYIYVFTIQNLLITIYIYIQYYIYICILSNTTVIICNNVNILNHRIIYIYSIYILLHIVYCTVIICM